MRPGRHRGWTLRGGACYSRTYMSHCDLLARRGVVLRRAVGAAPFLLAAVLVAASVACSSSTGGASNAMSPSGDDGQDGGGGAMADAAEASAPPPPVKVSNYDIAKTYAGNYAARIQFRKTESAGTLGSMDATVTIYGTVVITDDPASSSLSFAAHYCRSVLMGTGTGLLMGSGLMTPDVVMSSTNLDPVPFSAAMENGAVRWSVPEVHGPVGWTWTTPSDALPTSNTDPRVVDQDGDGNPGVTIDVTLSTSSFPVYVVQTDRDTFSGTADSSGNLTAVVVDGAQQNVIGSSNPLFAMASLTTVPTSDTSQNVARFVRVPSALACADLLTQIGTLFN
jgi:hypothetical protein